MHLDLSDDERRPPRGAATAHRRVGSAPAYRTWRAQNGRSEPRLGGPDCPGQLATQRSQGTPCNRARPAREGLGVSERFERATSSLWKYRRWPDRVKSRLENISNARRAVRRDYPADTLFEFALLPPKERRALADDIFAIYEACLQRAPRKHRSNPKAKGRGDARAATGTRRSRGHAARPTGRIVVVDAGSH